MSNYTIVTNFLAKDSLASGNPAKLIKGADFTTEFTAVQTAINSKPDGSVQFFPDGSATQPSIGFTNNAGTGMFNAAGVLGFATGATLRLSISAAGLVTVGTTVAAASALVVQAEGAGGAASLQINSNGVQAAEFTFNNSGSTDSYGVATGNVGLHTLTSSGSLTIGTNAIVRVTINAGGNVTIAAPTSGAALSLAGSLAFTTTAAAAPAIGAYASGTNILSFATNSAQAGFFDANQILNVYNGATISPVYAGIPQGTALTGGSATLVLSDANRFIPNFSGAARTGTIPANASVAYPIGTAITFVEGGGASMTIAINTDTLQFGSLTGSRALAANSMATAIKVASTTWFISGTGLT